MNAVWNKRIAKILLALGVSGVFFQSDVRAEEVSATREIGAMVQEKLAEINAQENEMNFILELMKIKTWHPPLHEIGDQPVDAPLGKYSEKEFQKYSEREIDVQIDYYCGGYDDDEILLIQVIQISGFDGSEYFGYCAWLGDEVYNGVWRLWGGPRYKRYPDNERQTEAEEMPCGNKRADEQGAEYRGGVYLSREHIATDIANAVGTVLSIKDKSEAEKLQDLPLTEKFFYECQENFPYINNIERMNKFELYDYYGISEDGRMICICALSPSDKVSIEREEYGVYYVEMELVDDQIDSMNIKLVCYRIPLREPNSYRDEYYMSPSRDLCEEDGRWYNNITIRNPITEEAVYRVYNEFYINEIEWAVWETSSNSFWIKLLETEDAKETIAFYYQYAGPDKWKKYELQRHAGEYILVKDDNGEEIRKSVSLEDINKRLPVGYWFSE